MKLVYAICFLFLLSACDKKSNSDELSGFVTKPDSPDLPKCEAAQLKNQFVVVWKDGSISREYSRDRESFIRLFMEENKEYIQFAEHDYFVEYSPVGKGDLIDFDKSFDNWGLINIDALSAWKVGAKGQGVTVAVIDSGTDVTHSALQKRIAININEIPDNGIDDDNNGYIDDYLGYSFVTNDDNVSQGSLHGTHVSGIIAAEHSGSEISTNTALGVAPEAKILPLKFIDANGGGYVSDAIAAIDYALMRKVQIINASWGGGCSESLRLKIEQLSKHKVLFVAAAGNSSSDIDVRPEFPAAYSSDIMLTVGAITKFNGLAFFSNYGKNRVHLFAPGADILSTTPKNEYRYLDGTSMAAPFVSGAAAVLWSDRLDASPQQIKKAILDSVVVEKNHYGETEYHNRTSGRLHLGRALVELQSF